MFKNVNVNKNVFTFSCGIANNRQEPEKFSNVAKEKKKGLSKSGLQLIKCSHYDSPLFSGYNNCIQIYVI